MDVYVHPCMHVLLNSVYILIITISHGTLTNIDIFSLRYINGRDTIIS